MTDKQKKADVYTQVTNTIIAAIEKGAGTFQMPWHQTGSTHMCPVNIDTGNAYRGINIISLWASAQGQGFTDGTWGTYRQWQNQGCQVRKGEKSSLVIFYKEYEAKDASDNEDPNDNRRFAARASYVFNAAQVDGYEPVITETPPAQPIETLQTVEHFVQATGADIRIGGERACYSLLSDHIEMPDKTLFTGSATSSATESWYSVLLHELTHWTGHAKRLERIKPIGTKKADYAREELVAEIGAAFLCAELGVTLEPRADHAAYIDHWLEILREDKRAIFKASSAASRAVEYLKGLQ